MTDLKMTQLCGRAMGYDLVQRSTRRSDGWWAVELTKHYDPLGDNAQAMELVKMFHILLMPGIRTPNGRGPWHAEIN